DVLGVLQSHPFPRLAGVRGFVDPVAEADAALVVVLTGTEPDDVGVFRIDDDRAERVRAAGVEDWLERVAAVLGLPQAAPLRRDIPDVGILRVDLDVGDAPGGDVRADAAKRKILEHGLSQAGRLGGKRHAACEDGYRKSKSSVHGRGLYGTHTSISPLPRL